MPNAHSIDFAFNSTIASIPGDTDPIALAYSFVLLTPQGNHAEGQKVEKIPSRSPFSFDAFDESNNPSDTQSISGSVAFIADKNNPSSAPRTPLKDKGGNYVPENMPLSLVYQGTDKGSAGCNINKATWWSDYGYTVVTNSVKGSVWRYTYSVTINFGGKTYRVDPELIVEGGS